MSAGGVISGTGTELLIGPASSAPGVLLSTSRCPEMVRHVPRGRYSSFDNGFGGIYDVEFSTVSSVL